MWNSLMKMAVQESVGPPTVMLTLCFLAVWWLMELSIMCLDNWTEKKWRKAGFTETPVSLRLRLFFLCFLIAACFQSGCNDLHNYIDLP